MPQDHSEDVFDLDDEAAVLVAEQAMSSAWDHMWAEEWDEARAALDRAAPVLSDVPMFQLIEAGVRWGMGQPALAFAERAVAFYPDSALAHTIYAGALVTEPGKGAAERWALASTVSQRAIDLAPDNVWVLATNAQILQHADPAKALELTRLVSALDPRANVPEYVVATYGSDFVDADLLLSTWFNRAHELPDEQRVDVAHDHEAVSSLRLPAGTLAGTGLVAGLLFNAWADGWPRWAVVVPTAVVVLVTVFMALTVIPARGTTQGAALGRVLRKVTVIPGVILLLAGVAAAVSVAFAPVDQAGPRMSAAVLASGLAWVWWGALGHRTMRAFMIDPGSFIDSSLLTWGASVAGVLGVFMVLIGLTPSTQPGAPDGSRIVIAGVACLVLAAVCLTARLRRWSRQRRS